MADSYDPQRDGWVWLDGVPRDDLPPMPKAVSDALDAWLHMEHGIVASHTRTGHFLDLLEQNGYAVERVEVASARSYTTLDRAEFVRERDPELLTEARIQAEDPTWQRPSDPDAPVRSLA